MVGCQSRPQSGAYVTFYSDPPDGRADGNSMPVRQFWSPDKLSYGFPRNCANVMTPTVRWPDGVIQGPTSITVCRSESYYTIRKPIANNPPSTSSPYEAQIYTDGDSYYGQLSNGKRSGFGTYYFKKRGDRYEGYFVDGLRHGSGKYTFKNGNYFVGNYKNDKRDGPGKEYSSAGVILRDGIWSNGTLISSINVPDNPKNQEKSIIENESNKSARKRCLSIGFKSGTADFNECLKSIDK